MKVSIRRVLIAPWFIPLVLTVGVVGFWVATDLSFKEAWAECVDFCEYFWDAE